MLAGAGHGGAEAIILGAIVLYSFVQLAYLRNADISKIVSASQVAAVQQQVSSYWSLTWYASLRRSARARIRYSGPYRHVRTRPADFHAQAMVLGVAGGAVSCGAGRIVVCLSPRLGALPTEALVGAFAVLSVILIFALRRPEPAEDTLPPAVPPAPAFAPKPLEATPENLDRTRYA